MIFCTFDWDALPEQANVWSICCIAHSISIWKNIFFKWTQLKNKHFHWIFNSFSFFLYKNCSDKLRELSEKTTNQFEPKVLQWFSIVSNGSEEACSLFSFFVESILFVSNHFYVDFALLVDLFMLTEHSHHFGQTSQPVDSAEMSKWIKFH